MIGDWSVRTLWGLWNAASGCSPGLWLGLGLATTSHVTNVRFVPPYHHTTPAVLQAGQKKNAFAGSCNTYPHTCGTIAALNFHLPPNCLNIKRCTIFGCPLARTAQKDTQKLSLVDSFPCPMLHFLT